MKQSQQNISKVVFIADSYRGNRALNVNRLYRLFSHVFHANDIECDIRLSEINKIEEESCLDVWKHSMMPSFHSEFEGIDTTGLAFIAFEMSRADRAYLDSVGVPWIDFEIHPVRFLDDLYFNVESSCSIDFSSIVIPDDYIAIRADILRSKYQLSGMEKDAIRKLLIIGQSPIDKSVFFDGEFKQLTSYLDTIDAIAKDFDSVEYKPHPYVSDPQISEHICSRYSAKICDEKNIYKLFCEEKISAVAAISSSVLHEAPYFSVKSFALEPRAKKFGQPISYAKLVRDAHLWVGPLIGKPLSRRACDWLPPVPENYLREMYGSWSYESDEQTVSNRISGVESKLSEEEKIIHQTREALDQVESRLRQAEVRAQEIELRVQQAESWARQVVREAELSRQQVETHVQKVELLMQQTEIWAQQVARDAESSRQQAEARAQEVELWMQQTEKWVQQVALEAKSNYQQVAHEAESYRARLEEANARIAALHASTSWRITKPMRGVKRVLGGDVEPIRRLVAGSAVTAKTVMRPLVAWGIRAVFARPVLRANASRLLKRWPWLHRRLMRVAVNTGIVSGMSSRVPAAAVDSASESMHKSSLLPVEDDAGLSPYARLILKDLKKAIARRQGGSN